jgi:hypothetical protein
MEQINYDADHVMSVQTLIRAIEAVCRVLKVRSKDDPLAEIIALKVIEAARGEQDPDRNL